MIETQSCQAVFSAHLTICNRTLGRALRASGQTPPVTPRQTLESRQHSSFDSPTSTPLRDCSNSECKRLLPQAAQCTIFEEGDRQLNPEGANANKTPWSPHQGQRLREALKKGRVSLLSAAARLAIQGTEIENSGTGKVVEPKPQRRQSKERDEEQVSQARGGEGGSGTLARSGGLKGMTSGIVDIPCIPIVFPGTLSMNSPRMCLEAAGQGDRKRLSISEDRDRNFENVYEKEMKTSCISLSKGAAGQEGRMYMREGSTSFNGAAGEEERELNNAYEQGEGPQHNERAGNRPAHPYHPSFRPSLKELSLSNTSSVYRSLSYSNTSSSESASEHSETRGGERGGGGERKSGGEVGGPFSVRRSALQQSALYEASNAIVASGLVAMTKATATATSPHHRDKQAQPEHAFVKPAGELSFELELEQARKVSAALHFAYRMQIDQR